MTTELIARVDSTRPGSLVLAAAIVGLLAGFAAATVAYVAGEPAIRDAIALEEAAAAVEEREAAADHHHGEDAESATVSRSHQSGIGLFGAYGLTGIAFGAFLGLAVHGLRRGRPEIARRVYLSGVILAGAFTLAPWLKYPPNPPAVGDPDSLVQRQTLYVSLIVVTLVVGLAAAALGRRLRIAGWDEHVRVPAVVVAVVAPLGLAMALMAPAPDATPVPAGLLWQFRVASLAANATLWAVLTLGLGWVLAEAVRRRAADPVPAAVPVSA